MRTIAMLLALVLALGLAACDAVNEAPPVPDPPPVEEPVTPVEPVEPDPEPEPTQPEPVEPEPEPVACGFTASLGRAAATALITLTPQCAGATVSVERIQHFTRVPIAELVMDRETVYGIAEGERGVRYEFRDASGVVVLSVQNYRERIPSRVP